MTLQIKNHNSNVKGLHIPIMQTEITKDFNLKEGDTVVDCTVNRGGHSIEFAKQIGSKGTLICIDLDRDALEEAKANLSALSNPPTIHFANDNFADLDTVLMLLRIEKVDGIFLDLGLSSQELDISGRGFTFLRNEPLLMTFRSEIDEDTLTAQYIVNNWNEETLADIIYNFSDERYARRIAKSICEVRKHKEINTTFDLVDAIGQGVPAGYHNGKTHFATKTFQAIRMAVNDEVNNLIKVLETAKNRLNSNGRLALLTFHSTEDRLVKKLIDLETFKKVNKKVIVPSRDEIGLNPRSRSCKLRVYKRIE